MDSTAKILSQSQNSSFIELVRMIGLPGLRTKENDQNLQADDGSGRLTSLAELNKIGLLYSLASNKPSKELLARNELLNITLKELGSLFSQNQISYCVFKTVKPFPTTPSDIDVLVDPTHLGRATNLLESRGFKITADDAYSTTLQKGNMIIDLQLQPSVSNLPYISKKFLMQNVVTRQLDGHEVKNLSDEAEIIVIASHSLYKEQMFTLSDYYSITLLSERVADIRRLVDLARSSNTIDALRITSYLCGQITNKAFGISTKINEISNALGESSYHVHSIQEMPLKFPFSLVIKLLIRRARKDRELRRMMLPAMMRIVSPSQLKKLVSHLRRQTY